jgi:protein-tyrosine-phosphatase
MFAEPILSPSQTHRGGALTTGKVQAADVVITMGCGDACPVFPGKRYLGLANAARQRAGRRSQPSRTAGPPALGITQP